MALSVCFGSDDGGLSYGPYKQVVVVKSINNYSNNKPHDPHGFKEEVKIKYDAVKAVIGKSPKGARAIIELLGVKGPVLDWVACCEGPTSGIFPKK